MKRLTRGPSTIDNKAARQIKLADKKAKKDAIKKAIKEEKKASKMDLN